MEPGLPQKMNEARMALSAERALLLRVQRQELEGRLHDVAECEARRMQQIHAARNAFMGLGRSLAPDLVGKKRGQIEKIIATRIERILNAFAEGE